MKLLLTAFDPFGGADVNPAERAVSLVAEKVGAVSVTKLTVPTVFYRSIETVAAAIVREKPDAVLCIGQAGGCAGLAVERVGINIDDARIPDNAGAQPVDRPIFPDGENAYFATLPIKAMVKNIRAAGLPATVSNSAGTFVCNHLLYGLLYTLAKNSSHIRGGFIHVPYLPEQAAALSSPASSMSAADIARGIEAAIAAIGECEKDIAAAEGALH
ncbi:MAG: pyroglutamyl-peptidase I [Clostridiales bacterium]|nr:pyroglutamyl-peptidase I [Clostridiales bacterium]